MCSVKNAKLANNLISNDVLNCVFCAAKIVQGRNNAVLCTIAQMANKREGSTGIYEGTNG